MTNIHAENVPNVKVTNFFEVTEKSKRDNKKMRYIIFGKLLLAQECVDEELRLQCESDCMEDLFRCLNECTNDHNCNTACNRDYPVCNFNCPCNAG